jgi:hypothetical protein
MRFTFALALLGFALAVPNPLVDETAVARDTCPLSSVDEALLAVRNVRPIPSALTAGTCPRQPRLRARLARSREARVLQPRLLGQVHRVAEDGRRDQGQRLRPSWVLEQDRAGAHLQRLLQLVSGARSIADSSHDICYTKCGTTKATCDQVFLACMVGKCTAKYGKLNPVRYICTDLATKYYGAVFAGGCPAFKSASKKHCKC